MKKGPFRWMVGMIVQIVCDGDFDFRKTIEKIQKEYEKGRKGRSKIEWIDPEYPEGTKNVFTFILSKFPEDKIQLTEKGKIIINTKDISIIFEKFIEYTNALYPFLVGRKVGKKRVTPTISDYTYNLKGISFKDLAEIAKKITSAQK